MILPFCVKKYDDIKPDPLMIKRYMRDRAGNPAMDPLIEECIGECEELLDCRICAYITPLNIDGDKVDLGFASVKSRDLADNLAGCRNTVIFAATAGLGIDRLVKRYSDISPLKALCIDALGSDSVEQTCDRFNEELGKKYILGNTRFSPGYGDLPISFQKAIFLALEIGKYTGVHLTDGVQMVPSKSVTAILGVKDEIS